MKEMQFAVKLSPKLTYPIRFNVSLKVALRLPYSIHILVVHIICKAKPLTDLTLQGGNMHLYQTKK